MSVYSYTARAKNGSLVKGKYEAADKITVINSLKSKGYLPVDIKQQKLININFLGSRIKTKEISVFCRQFATVIEAGIPVLESLDIIRKQTESKRLEEILNKVYEQVQKGRSLSDGLREFQKEIPSILINMIEAGEASGTLDKVLNRMAIFFENENKIVRKVKGAMTYPTVVACVAVVAVIVMLKFVVPQFISMFAGMGSKLPLPTEILIKASDFIGKYFLLLILIIFGGIVGIIRYIRTDQGKFAFDRFKLRIPKIKTMYTKMLAARFARTMASLLSSGIPLIRALEITDKVLGNSVMSKYLVEVIENISRGSKLSVAISQVPIFPIMLNSMISIGEESGALDTLLDKTADFYEEETEAEVEGLTALMEPLIIVVLAVVIGSIIVSMVTPMFSMMQDMSNM